MATRKRQRREFGRLVEKKQRKTLKSGTTVYTYLEASYVPPVWAFEKWPGTVRKRIYKKFPIESRFDAEAWLAQAKKSIDAETWRPPAVERATHEATTVTFAEYARDYVVNHHKPNGDRIAQTTREKYEQYLRDHLLATFGSMPMTAITETDVQQWWDDFPVRKGGYGESARKHVYDLLRAIFHEATTKHDGVRIINENPCTIKAAKPVRKCKPIVAEPDELQTVAQAMPEWQRLTVWLAGVLGLRMGEVLGLQRRDFHLEQEQPQLDIRQSAKVEKGVPVLGKTKTPGSVRTYDVPDFLVPIIRKHLERFCDSKASSLLFTAPRSGGVVRETTVSGAWCKARKRAPRLANMRFNDLRHTALTRAAEWGASPGTLKAMAGHTKDSTMLIYQDASDANRKQTTERINAAYAPSSTGAESSSPAADVLAALDSLPEESKRQVLEALLTKENAHA